jgi:hypothetical protein
VRCSRALTRRSEPWSWQRIPVSLEVTPTDLGVVMAVSYASSTFIVSTTLSNTATTGGSSDIAIVKLTSAGALSFASTYGSTGTDVPYVVDADSSNLPYACGHFTSTSMVMGSTTLTNAGTSSYDIWVAKYTAIGGVTWAKSFGGTNSDGCTGLAVDSTGNVYFGGFFLSSTITFGTTTLTNTATGYDDAYLVKLSSAGAVTWAKSWGGTSDDQTYAMGVYSTTTVFLSIHYYSPTLSFATGSVTNTGILNDVLVKVDASTGTVTGTTKIGSTQIEATSVRKGLVVSSTTSLIYACGYFRAATLTIGSTILTNTRAGFYDVFIAKKSL